MPYCPCCDYHVPSSVTGEEGTAQRIIPAQLAARNWNAQPPVKYIYGDDSKVLFCIWGGGKYYQ